MVLKAWRLRFISSRNKERTMDLVTKKVVGVGDFYVTDEAQEVVVTYSLGSCVGVTAYDPQKKVGGLLHFMLPDSILNQEKAAARPAMFGDTGLTSFLNMVFGLGASRANLVIKLAGGAKPLASTNDFFNIGERNLVLAKQFLWKNGLMVTREDTGGTDYRTMYLEMETGRVVLKGSQGVWEL